MDAGKDIRNIFIYKSPVGTMSIKYDHRSSKWMLGLGDEVYGLYETTIAAADDVYSQSSGSYEWDSFDIDSILEDVPTDIYCWDIIKRK